MPESTVERKRVLVTGSSRGIGRAIALKLAGDGFDAVVHCFSNVQEAERTAQCVRELGGRGRFLQFDVGRREESREILIKEVEDNGAFFGVVLSAGIYRDGPFPGLSDSDWQEVIDVNLNGFYNVIHPLTMPMIQRRDGGRIVTIGSVAGIAGNRGQVNYSAAKAGLIGATRALSKELAKRGITVNCVAPGFVESDMTSGLPIEEIIKEIPMRRLGTPDEVAGLVSYLFSEPASYVTGQVISINGGLL